MRTTRRTLLLALLLLALAAPVVWWATRTHDRAASDPPATPARIVAALRTEPRTFNRLFAVDRASLVVSQLLHARLVRLNHATQEIEPALAESWTMSADGRSYTLSLRRDVAFSDGAPFTSADVVFTFDALHDPRTASPLASGFLVSGKRIDVRAVDRHSIVLTYPEPYGPGLRGLQSLPILPAHRLKAALEAGTLRDQWTVKTPPDELVGLGPFVLRSYQPR